MPFCPLRHTAMVLASNPVRLLAEATPFAGEASRLAIIRL